MKLRIRELLVFGLLIAACHSPAAAQLNCGYYERGSSQPILEPYYTPHGLITGSHFDPGPAWLGQATFDILLFDRSDADSRTIVREQSSGDPILDTTDLGFPVTAAFRFNLALTGRDGCDFVFNYLGAKFDTSRTHRAATASYDFFELDGITPATGSSFQSSYMSTLNSIELNSRTRRWHRFAPLAGLRYISLEDEFERLASDMGLLKSSTTNNDLWGFQIGGEALLWDTGPVRLQTTMKGGVFYNDLRLRTGGGPTTVTDPITMVSTSLDPTAAFSSSHVSFFGELSVEYAYQVCPQVAIRVGYTAMWLDAVALAPDQHDNFIIQSGVGDFDLGTVLYHGSYIGVDVTW